MYRLLVSCCWLLLVVVSNAQTSYFPSASGWKKQSPAEAGFDTAKLNDAIRFAISNENKLPRDLEKSQAIQFGKEPYWEPIGPFVDRGNPSGVIIRHGYIVAEWGEPSRVDMTHSVTKSFLSTVVGLAVDRGMIRDVNDKVSDYITGLEIFDTTGLIIRPFASNHNKKLNWEVMLRQTSDWEGTLWGKPDWADRPEADTAKSKKRKRIEPGEVFEYNDVRVNALALAATVVWKRSLANVLEEYIMKPIGATATWQWHGYRNSWIILGGSIMQSVSGGGHWGGGMFINAYDMARFGLLTLHNGNWNGQQLISPKWLQQALTPTKAKTDYGYMNFYLNTDRKYFPAAPASAVAHMGNGTNMIYVDRENDIVMVVRWIENSATKEMVKKVLESLN